MEYQRFVNTVQKLRFKNLLYFVHDTVLHEFVILFCIFSGSKAQLLWRHNGSCPCIGCHNNNCIFEIPFPALGICNMSVIQYLQQNIKYVRMCFLNLIKENDCIRISPYLFT